MNKIIEVIMTPITWLIDSALQPFEELFVSTMFTLDNPFILPTIAHKYYFFMVLARRLLVIVFVITLLLYLLGGKATQKGELSLLLSRIAKTGMLLALNSAILIMINRFFELFTLGMAADMHVETSFASFLFGGVIASAIAIPLSLGFGLIILLVLVGLIFLLFVSMDMIQIVVNAMVMISPIIIALSLLPIFDKYLKMFYSIYIGSNFTALTQVAIMVSTLALQESRSFINIFAKLSVSVASVALMIVVIPMLLFKAISIGNQT